MIFLLLTSAAFAAQWTPASAGPTGSIPKVTALVIDRSTTALGGVPSLAPSLVNVSLGFEPGIRNSEFVAHAGGLGVTLTSTGASIGASRMRLVGARAGASAKPEELLASYTNYLLDPDPRNWRTHVPNYRRVRYRNVYPGIDVVYYGDPRELEFDFVVAPGADPRRIRLTLDDPDLRIRLPRVYQNHGDIPARVVRHGGTVTFELAAYDRSRPLVIDPVLSFATIFGGGGSDQGRAIAVDSTGATYVAGYAGSGNFPVVNGKSGSGSFLAKVTAAGDALVYSTYLGFPLSGNYAVDATGSIYLAVAAYPSALNFSGSPVVGPAPLGNCSNPGGANLYVARLSPDGSSLIYSGCVGSAGFSGLSVAIDAAGNAYVAGQADHPTNFPLVNPLPSSAVASQGARPAFVLKLGPDGRLLYSTFFGGSSSVSSNAPPLVTSINAIAADAAGNIYLTGKTNSPDFPLKNPIQSVPPSFNSAFIAKIKAEGSDLVYSTYFGGSNSDFPSAIAADASGNTYVAGSTTSGDFPTTPNALQSRFNSVLAYKSNDAGATWSRSDLGLPGGVSSVRVDPRNPSNIYAVSSNRVYKSSDKGATWQPTPATPAGSLWINPVDSTLYATVVVNHAVPMGSIWRSHDGGATFAMVDTGLSGTPNLVFDPTNASVIYGHWAQASQCQTAGIYKSTDGGDTWKATVLTGCGTGPGALAIDPAHPSTLYASTHQGGLVRSDDGGDTWTTIGPLVDEVLVDASSTLYTVSGNVVDVTPPGGAAVTKVAPAIINMLVIDPTNSSIWYAIASGNPGRGIYKTTDSGDTWQPVTNGLPSSLNPGSLEIDPSASGTLYLGASPLPDGIFAKLSPDGTSLLYSTYLGGSGTDSVTAIATDASGNAYLVGATDSSDFPMQAPFRTSGGGFAAKFDPANALAWSSLLGGATPTAIALGPEGEAYLTGSTSSAAFPTVNSIQPYISSNFFYSADGGASWTASSPTGGSPLTYLPFAPVIAVDPKTPSRVYALADRLYVSNDRGRSWKPLGTPGSPYTWASSGPTLLLDPFTPTTIYAAGMCQSFHNNCGVSKSTDGGLTWTVSSNSPLVPGVSPPITMLGTSLILGMAIDPKTPSNLYASTGFGIFKSTDGAATWNLTGSLGSAGAVAAVAVDLLNSAVLYASVGNSLSAGIYKSTDAGATFTAISNGLPSGWFANSLVPVPSVPGRVYAIGSFAPTKDVYRTDDSGNTWMKVGSGMPDGPVSALAVDPGNSSVVYAAPSVGGLYRSTDAGATFSPVPGMRIPIVSSVAIDPTNSSQIYSGSQFNPSDVFVMRIAP
jgi:photosystem II stability/assembly factor-like uncharacterized protein